MAIILKKIGSGEYAYLSKRDGAKVVHTYLGPAKSDAVQYALAEQKEVSMVPNRLNALFWDTSIENININRHASYIIGRVLELGDFSAIEWIQKVYPSHKITEVINTSRELSDKSRNFWQIWFGGSHA
jgi:hypothetical protein